MVYDIILQVITPSLCAGKEYFKYSLSVVTDHEISIRPTTTKKYFLANNILSRWFHSTLNGNHTQHDSTIKPPEKDLPVANKSITVITLGKQKKKRASMADVARDLLRQ